MFQSREKSGFGRGLFVIGVLSGVMLGACLFVGGASAGECPADQKKPNAREAVDVGHDGVTDTVIAMIDVDKEQGIKDRAFRMRRLNIESGATVPWHSHAERPAIIYIIEGTVEEYASNCAVPIVHRAGDVVAETKDVSHWWKNTGDETVVLISADLLKDPTDKTM
jgi:quercetin dioxygenase-like cupin family protein